jgi:1-phosphatidylinositol-4-phosphate 5-kinase
VAISVLDQVDTHDLLKLLRWRRTGRNENQEKKQKSYLKGKVIDGEHELYTLSIAVMIGVRTSISRTNTELNAGPPRRATEDSDDDDASHHYYHRWVKPMDFDTAEKYEFRPKGDSTTPPHMLAHTFKFKDYSPVVFAYLRRMFGVNEYDFLLSVCGNANFIEFISNAKSGQFFFYSNDGRYMIKTMTNAESKFLRRGMCYSTLLPCCWCLLRGCVVSYSSNTDGTISLALPDYFRHCAENPNTTITRFFGMYRVKLYHLRRNVKFVIMNSVYYTDKYLQSFYDLKGSSIGRDAKAGQAVKKDNDLRRGLPAEALALPPKQREALRTQLVSDCKFLEAMGIMDYSMLVGVHHVPADEDGAGSIATLGFRGTRPRLNSICRPEAECEPDHSGYDATQMGRKSQTEEQPHHLNEKIGAFFRENGLDEDDGSYLEGVDGNQERPFNVETERKKQATIEKLYWPFHRYFDIHGHRRGQPAFCVNCSHKPCICEYDQELLRGYNIPTFVAPISNRKDGGLEMDATGQKLPMTFHLPTGDLHCDGKIFFMGIIDILQEYSSRKVLESTYRAFTASRFEASCVAPFDYAKRFIHFFDDYTQPLPLRIANEDGADQKKAAF